MAKKYHWLKLNDDFFNTRAVKKLRQLSDDGTYTVIYLKLLLLSVKDEGVLYDEGIEESFAEDVALEIDEDPESVQRTIEFLEKAGLMIRIDDDAYQMTEIHDMIGGESESAERVRRHRNKKTLHCNTDVTECNGDVTECNGDVTQSRVDIDKSRVDKSRVDIEESRGEDKARARFVPPTLEEVAAYCQERQNNVNPDKFISHYQSNGWMVGKSKMKDWRAAVRTWEHNGFDTKGKAPPGNELEDFYNFANEWAESGE